MKMRLIIINIFHIGQSLFHRFNYERGIFLYSIKDLDYLQNTKIPNPTDINDVIIDKKLPITKRLESFLEQVKNPYAFQCNDVYVKLSYSENGTILHDMLKKYFTDMK